MKNASEVRSRLHFDVERLRQAAHRLEKIDHQLTSLRRGLETRAAHLAREAMSSGPTHAGEGIVQIRRSQAQATAHLAKRAALGEVLRSSSPLALIAAMAASRWVGSLRPIEKDPMNEAK